MMKTTFLCRFWLSVLLAFSAPALPAFAQELSVLEQQLASYRAAAPRINNLVHTRLDVRFDYARRFLYGKAWITLKPHFYPTDSLRLDAKGMLIRKVALVNGSATVPLQYSYDSLQLAIKLNKVYSRNDEYQVFIEYVARPEELEVEGSAAINDAKGLYFINPDGTDKEKPVQIWTQGETESSSAWFPTIDKPNQKTTSEISMTVPAKYVTLSNGRLASQKTHVDGTRTDTWKMELPHAPYLFMMAVGDFKIYKDKWRDKELSYYLEPAYAPYAKEIFGDTPEMMEFFSTKLGIDYPWNKYAQVVVRDYVSGAMENTTASVFGEFVQATPRELLDKHPGEAVIAHELFHHWFGDYVTAESWSNLTVNESFADFSEVLWMEHKHGKDAGDAHGNEALQSYLNSEEDYAKHLVRFHYHDKEDMFDLVSYQKGGRILNMLRNYLGEDAFFKGLNLYLRQNAFKSAEAHHLRLALEETTGKDLNWFFNQWYFRNGHPALDISYQWDSLARRQLVIIRQTQPADPYILPLAVDVYENGGKKRHQAWLRNKADTLSFAAQTKPLLVNVDADKVLLAEKTDKKTLAELAYQYFNAPLYMDRLEAIDSALSNQQSPEGSRVVLAALKDRYWGLREKTIRGLDLDDVNIRRAALPVLKELAGADPRTLVQAAALEALASLRDSSYRPLFDGAMKSPSYAVQGAALTGIALLDPQEGFRLAKSLEEGSKASLVNSVVTVYALYGSEAEIGFVAGAYEKAGLQEKVEMIPAYIHLLSRIDNSQIVLDGVSRFMEIAQEYKQYGLDQFVLSMLHGLRQAKQAQLREASGSRKEELNKQISALSDSIKEIGT